MTPSSPGFDVSQFLPGDEGIIPAHLADRGAHLPLVLVHQLVVLLLLVGALAAPAAIETGAGDARSGHGGQGGSCQGTHGK